METKKAILLINSSFYPSVGGVENSMLSLARSLTLAGERVVVITGNKSNRSDKKLASEEFFCGFKVYRYSLLPLFLYYISCTLLILRLKREYDFCSVVSRSSSSNICCYFSGLRNVKYIASSVYALSLIHI